MSDDRKFFINPLPTRTWNHLRMNETAVDLPSGGCAVPVQTEREGSWIEQSGAAEPAPFAAVQTGCGGALKAFLQSEAAGTNAFFKNDRTEDVLRLGFHYTDGAQGRNVVVLDAGEDALLTVVEDFSAEEKASGTGIVQTLVRAAKGSLVRLIQIHRGTDGFMLINDTGAECADGARVEVIHVIQGGGTNYIGCLADLIGDRSSFAADIAYTVCGENRLDMNYVVLQKGRKTDSRVDALGVLRDHAFKLFRGTIDFKNGSCESVGNEKENVLLLDEDVVNKTIPLILCAEEDVEGNHGATIGELDADTLFYLETRGIPREEVSEMVARGRMDSVIRMIPDEKTRNALLGSES